MTRVYLALVITVLCLRCGQSCDPKKVEKIKDYRPISDGSDLFENVPRQYNVVFMDIGPMTAFLGVSCVTAYYEKGDDGYFVTYKGSMDNGQYKVTYDNEGFRMEDKYSNVQRAYVVYRSPDTNVLAFYTCLVSWYNIYSGMVFVNSNALDSSADQVEAAKQALHDIGIKKGVDVPTKCTPSDI